MSGYYIKTPFAGLWDILHPDNGDTVVARCYTPEKAWAVCEKLNAKPQSISGAYQDLKQEVVHLKKENDFIRKTRDVLLKKRDEALEQREATATANVYLKSDLTEAQSHLRVAEQEIARLTACLDGVARSRDMALAENAKKRRRSLYNEEGETLVELTVLYTNHGFIHGQRLSQNEDVPFAAVSETLCDWAEEFHKVHGDGPWDSYYEMVEDFFLLKIRAALDNGDFRLVRR